MPLHGSWNRAAKTGYKVIDFPWTPWRRFPDAQIDLVTGWLVGGATRGRTGRCRGGAGRGHLYLGRSERNDLQADLLSTPPPPTGSIASFTSSCNKFACSLTTQGSTNATDWSWTFGDGSSGSGQLCRTRMRRRVITRDSVDPAIRIAVTLRRPSFVNPKGC